MLGFSGSEVAETLETTPASVYSLLQRAHRTVNERLPARSQQASLRALGDAALTMPPSPTWYQGREAVTTFLRGWPFSGEKRWRLVPTVANGQPALGKYIWDPGSGSFVPLGLNVLTLDGARIGEITAFLTPEAFGRFDLLDGIRP